MPKSDQACAFQILSDSPRRLTPNDARTQRTRDARDGAMESDTYDDDFEVSDDSITVEMASAVKPNAPDDTPSTTKSKKVATDASNAPRSRAPGSLTADLRIVAVPASSKTGQPRAVALLARRSASKDPTPKPTNDASLNVKPKIPSDTAQMRLSSAFEKTLDTWHDRDGVAADNLSLQTQVDAQLAEMAGLQLKCQSLEAAAMADRERAAEHAKSLENAVAKERKLRLEADRAAADAKASATPWGQMAKGNVDVKCGESIFISKWAIRMTSCLLTVSIAEADTLRREIQTQDAIMRGYQKENETAIDTIASMKREFTVKEGDFVGQIERLNGEIARLRLESERTGGDSSRHLERQLAAEASLKVQALEFAERERELTREREASRAAARAAEAKLAGVDYEAIEKVRLF